MARPKRFELLTPRFVVWMSARRCDLADCRVGLPIIGRFLSGSLRSYYAVYLSLPSSQNRRHSSWCSSVIQGSAAFLNLHVLGSPSSSSSLDEGMARPALLFDGEPHG